MHRIALAIVLAAAAGPAFALDCPEGMRPFVHAAGEDCIPEDPQRIVTLQDQNGLLPLMELGVRPVGSAGHINAEGEKVFRRMEGYDTSGVEWVGTYGGPPDPEAVAALEPDLVIASPWPPEAPELYGQIAPTIVIDMFDNPLDVALYQFADAVDRTERAAELEAVFREKAEAVRAKLGEALDTTTVSILTYNPEDGAFYPANPTQAMGLILGALEPVRPLAERGLAGDREYRSMETLAAHDADVMFHLVFDADDGGDSDAHAAFMAEPVVAALPVAQAGQIFPLDGTAMVGSAWGKVEAGLDMIADVLLREDLDRTLVDE